MIGQAAEQVGRGDDEHAAQQLNAGVGDVAVPRRGGQGESQ
jgi:hypothetical protein